MATFVGAQLRMTIGQEFPSGLIVTHWQPVYLYATSEGVVGVPEKMPTKTAPGVDAGKQADH